MNTDQASNATPEAVCSTAMLGPLPEPRMWYDHATQRCSGMAPVGGTNERLWDASDMRAYAAAAVAAERERWQKWACRKEWDNVNDPPCHPSDTGWRPCDECEGPNAMLSGAATEIPTECGASQRPPRIRG